MKVLLFVNTQKDIDMSFSAEIIACLEDRNVEYSIFKAENEEYTIPPVELEGIEAVIVLGGDGTMLRAIQEVSQVNLPVLGVNIGRLGFLTEVDYNDFYGALKKLIDKDYYIEERMLLRAVTDEGIEAMAVNDVCVFGKEHGKIISVSVHVNGSFVEQFTGDGIIISSPTGSTGYSMSAGGPIVSPMAKCIIVTPICAHSLSIKPLVLCDSDRVTINVKEDKSGIAVLDGQGLTEVRRIFVKKNTYTAKFIRFKDYNFFDVLSQKFNNSIR